MMSAAMIEKIPWVALLLYTAFSCLAGSSKAWTRTTTSRSTVATSAVRTSSSLPSIYSRTTSCCCCKAWRGSTTKPEETTLTTKTMTTTTPPPTAWDALVGNISACIQASDLKRDNGTDGAATGWTAWIDEATCNRMQKCLDIIHLPSLLDNDEAATATEATTPTAASRDSLRAWLRWIRSTPVPIELDVSHQLRQAINETINNNMATASAAAEIIEEAKQDNAETESEESLMFARRQEELLDRISCRFISLPSGTSWQEKTPTGAMCFGKIFVGGVTRFRLIGGGSSGTPSTNNGRSSAPPRRVGERQVLALQKNSNQNGNNNMAVLPAESWLMYGGPPRSYQAVDIGDCLLWELVLLPKGPELAMMGCSSRESRTDLSSPDHVMAQCPSMEMKEWFVLLDQHISNNNTAIEQQPAGNENDFNVCHLHSTFCSTLGGLRPQVDEIVRRVLDGRVLRPATTTSSLDDSSPSSAEAAAVSLDEIRRQEMQGLFELGLHPIKGLLIYGPPGCGKTLLAREISKILNTGQPPKIVAAPELLDRFVGGSEKLIRELFQDAEDELRQCNGDATKSSLHVVVIDECDAVFRKRTANEGTSEVTRASAVNQILSKLDGIEALENVLLIGMTNKKELLDPALLRPGRLEVHIEIPLPDADGRREILQIQFGKLRKSGRLSAPLCAAIDGPRAMAQGNVGNATFPGGGNRLRRMRQWLSRLVQAPVSAFSKAHNYHHDDPVPKGQLLRYDSTRTIIPRQWMIRDLADDRWTGGFSGADIAGLVRCAGSIALDRSRKQNDYSSFISTSHQTSSTIGDDGILFITLEDVYQALQEVKQQ